MPRIQASIERSPLGNGVLQFHRMRGSEALGRPFEFELDLYSEDAAINIEAILGQPMSVRLELPKGKFRYFHGYVGRFAHAETASPRYAAYRATLRPWLWLLTRAADCRIFQEKTVPEIVEEVFKEHGFSDLDNRLERGAYRKWEYCVQYRETDFNFVSRLLEQEGIYYYFSHEADKHTLVLCEGPGSHKPIPGYEQVPYYPDDPHSNREEEHVSSWLISKEVKPGIYALSDFDFTRPKADLKTNGVLERAHARSKYEVFDYPGEYEHKADGEAYAKRRIEELQSTYETAEGQSDARGFFPGGLFTLTGSPRSDQNRGYLITEAMYRLECGDYESSGSSAEDDVYSCGFTAIPSREVFRPQRITPKPFVQGPQTAIVVGKAGEEIWTDKYGRVKVQFHWDRHGKSNETSSCWIRVAHAWAGQQWGSIFIPRVKQEVVVECLEGDPDRPIVTGCLYNGDNMPPYALDGEKTVSTLKSRSTPQGGTSNFNEIKFEDKKGGELLYVQAEKDRELYVKNNNSEVVDADETVQVGGDRSVTVDGLAHTLTTGQSKVTMKQDGTIEISGMEITLKTTSGKININAAGIVTINGTMVKIN